MQFKDRIMPIISKSKLLRMVLIILIITLSLLYLFAFFSKGVNYDDAFLRKEVIHGDTHYIGQSQWGKIHITVKGMKDIHSNIDVIYRLPNNIVKVFVVNFTDGNFLGRGIKIKDENGNLLFEGAYSNENEPFLYDKFGKPLLEGMVQVTFNYQSPYNADYKISLINVASFASFDNETVRGDANLLIFGILLLIIVIIDIKFPLFFFTLHHFLHVQDPEPTDFYIAVQRISWYVIPIVAFVLLVAAIL